MEGLLTFFLFMQIPDIVFAPVAAGGIYLFQDIASEIKAEEAIEDACEIYIKDYTELTPEWKWGNHKGELDFQELLGCPLDILQRDVFSNTLVKLEEGKSKPGHDYILRVYIKENVCVKVEYKRPMNKQFLACYGHGDELTFHTYSELLGKEYPIDMTTDYYNFLNFINGKDPQMLITARLCADKLPYVSGVSCHVLTMFNHPW